MYFYHSLELPLTDENREKINSLLSESGLKNLPDGLILVSICENEEGELIGTCSIFVNGSGRFEIGRLAVKEDYQRQGISKDLLAFVISSLDISPPPILTCKMTSPSMRVNRNFARLTNEKPWDYSSMDKRTRDLYRIWEVNDKGKRAAVETMSTYYHLLLDEMNKENK